MPTPAAPWATAASRIIFRHLLPNAITPAVVYWMTDMALAILLGSSLGYLGLGAQPPAAEWGVLIADGKNFMTTAWWISVFPGVAIVVTGLGFSLAGDGLAEILRTASMNAGGRLREATLKVRGLTSTFDTLARSFDRRRRHRSRFEAGRDRRARRRIRVRQERDLALDRAAGARAGQGQRPSIEWQGRRPAGACRAANSARCAGAEIAMIFQEPMTALNPVLPVRLQIEENLQAHTTLDGAARRARAWS